MRVVVARGRILEEFCRLLQQKGVPVSRPDNRRLLIPVSNGVELLVARPDDVPPLVSQGVGALGVVGLDTLREQEAELWELLDLGIARCRLVLAVPPSLSTLYPAPRPWRVATRYPRLTKAWFADRGVPVEVVRLSGAVESAVETGVADMVVDLADTGRTLRAHGLQEREVLLTVSSWVVAHPSGYYRHYEQVMAFLRPLVGEVAG